ncbi:conserved oligomeric Golgi complex subunit 8-like [Styela clava]
MFRIIPEILDIMSSTTSKIDIDDESVLTSIFKDSFPESWRSDPEFVTYLSELSSYGIEKLNREPDRLDEEKSHVLEQTQDLAFHNYKTFIKTAECSKDIFQDFSLIEDRLEGMIDKLPSLSEKAKSFMQAAQNIGASRRSNSLTLTRHTQILEILEIPQLMDTCVRNQYYDEALELMFYVKRMEKKHIITDIPVLGSIINDVKKSAQLMLHHLLSQLRTGIQLPACLRIIGYLRRLDCFSEVELRLKFLQARNSWLESILDAIPNDEAYTHVTRTIEACRIHLFDIVTQYRAIFSDETDLAYSFLPTQKGNDNLQDKPRDTSVFHSWLVYRISIFLDTLEKDLAKGVGNRLDSVLGQCMYFGLSFSRVGADFRGLLIPRFQNAAHSMFKQTIDAATQEFATDMMSFSLITTSIAYNQSMTGSMTSSMSASYGSSTNSPPASLLEFPPLGVYLNNVLAAFNDLRLCCPVALAPLVPATLMESLRCVVADILGFYHTEEAAFSDKERIAFNRYCTAFCQDMIPHIEECLTLLFPSNEIGNMFGITPSQLKSKFGKIGHMDTADIIRPLEPFLPAKEELVLDSGDNNVTTENEKQENGVDESVQSDDKESGLRMNVTGESS